jgi:multidrug efflux system membrane fusion protein
MIKTSIKTSYLIASGIAIVVAAWLLSGQLTSNEPVTPAGATSEMAQPVPAPLARVRVREQVAEPRIVEVVLRGQTVANRQVELRAETRGKVVEVPAEKGALVRTGDVVAQISNDDRKARLDMAKALLVQREIEYDNAQKLSKKGYRPETDVAETRAKLEEAKASLKSMEIDIGYTTIRAPFDGVVEERPAEIGDFADVGEKVATIVDLDPMLVVGHVSEQDVVRISVGMPGKARLVTGETVSGKVRFVGSTADAQTRTFRVELEVPNPDRRVVQGISAELQLPVAELPAHRVTSAILALTDDGKIGVKTVNADNVVEFNSVTIIGDGPDGVWLAGLPERVRFITVGQDFVLPGQKVEPTADSGEPAS